MSLPLLLPPPVQVCVLVATCDRSEFLAERCLPSIAAQTMAPRWLIVVDDSSTRECRERNERIVRGIPADPTKVVHLSNCRAQGCAGAWNTGIDWLHRQTERPERVYVAILDDDDCWEPGHLQACLDRALARDADMVAAGIVRHDSSVRRQTIPSALRAEEFLVGNPQIQGSNLFVRLEKLLLAGMFDEHLPSCTDRDLCIRIADLGGIRYEALAVHTVHHLADGPLPRLSDPGSESKLLGLQRFWSKYQTRMTLEQQQAFLTRGRDLFCWTPAPRERPPMPAALSIASEAQPFPLLVALTTDSASRSRPLLLQLLQLSRHPSIAGLDVLVSENGTVAEGRELRRLIKELGRLGLRCYFCGRGRQRRDARRGCFGHPLERPEKAPIALARTMLQTYLAELAGSRRDAVAWILDDDMRIESEAIIPWLQEFRRQGVDVVLGATVGAPPLPYASTVRTQMVDLMHNLTWLDALPDDDPLPDRSGENEQLRREFRDYYYDLSRRDTGHLESPFWLEPAAPGETVGEARQRVLSHLPRILAGEHLFRRVVSPPMVDPVADAKASDLRGGNTFVLNVAALRDVPNLAVELNGRWLRRSDMVWALINGRVRGRKVVAAPLPVRHDRSDVPSDGLDLDRLVQDIQGYAVHSALRDLLEWRGKERDDLEFGRAEVVWFVRRARKYLRERFSAFSLSVWRIRGVCRALRSRRAGGAVGAWLRGIEVEYAPGLLEEVKRRVMELDRPHLSAFLPGLREELRCFVERTPLGDPFARQRIALARSQVRRLANPSGALRLLGAGTEGVVVTDGRQVFKWIDGWTSRDLRRTRAFLRSLAGQWPDGDGLYQIGAFIQDGCNAILVYRFEESQPYEGGHGPGLVRLLQECRDHGVACSNMHPDNLRVVGEHVKLVDYGRDLLPFSGPGFRSMCVRAWLSWRWHHRPDLKEIMRRALTDEKLPELDGLARFLEAVNGPSTVRKLEKLLLRLTLDARPRRVLDFGCGKGRLAMRIAAEGIEVVGFDPDTSLSPAWETSTSARLTSRLDGIADRGTYDVVICSRVVCAIDSDEEYRSVLAGLRSAVAAGGQVLLALCDPFFTGGGPTPLQDRIVPADFDPSRVTVWKKRIRSSGRIRLDVHRPMERLMRDLLAAGLGIVEEHEIETVDLERFEPSSEFRVLRLVPIRRTAESVSLLIKTCAMEWRTIEPQVRHIVSQLQSPAPFCEVVLAVDSKRDGFERAYDRADADALERAIERLVASGLVDRVVRPDDVTALNQRWFGLATPATHSVDNAPVAPFLAGIESCRGDYVLQVDADMMIGRRDPRRDYLGTMIGLLHADPKAVTVAFPIFRHVEALWSAERPWRVEVRACLFHRQRLLALRPLPNSARNGGLDVKWHRSLDLLVRSDLAHSYRGGDGDFFGIHPPNDLKQNRRFWWAAVDAVERGYIPEVQEGRPGMGGSEEDWLGPKREEPLVVVICARNVPPGRFWRCWASLVQQVDVEWGAVVIDDASTPVHRDFMRRLCGRYRERVTFLSRCSRRGQLENLVTAVRHVCSDPDSIIVTLDGDDALLGRGTLRRVWQAHADGADATVGSMLRTDKHLSYQVDFDAPVPLNVWQHLRSFRKRLFDSIPDELLRLDGEYVALASDWAFMVPLVLLADRPTWIREPLYLHEPSGQGKGDDRQQREATISRILDRLGALGWLAGGLSPGSDPS